MNFTSLDFLGSWESIYVHFNTTKVVHHEQNHIKFGDDRNMKLAQ